MGPINQPLVMVTGKGGVGKSAIAASLALYQAQKGKRVLLVEVGEEGYYTYAFDQPIGHKPLKYVENLDVVRWTGESSLRELIGYLVKIKPLVDLFFDNKIMKTLIRVAPALKELAILGKLTSSVRGFGPPMDYDLVVFDGYSSGQFESLLKVPKGILKVIKKGPMYQQAQEIFDTIADSSKTKILVVALAEEMPIIESKELQQNLKDLGFDSELVVNQVFQRTLSSELGLDVSSNNGDDPFSLFLSNKLTNQKRYLAEIGEEVRTFPLVLEPKFTKVIETLSRDWQKNE